MAAPPVSPQPGSVPAEQAGSEHSNIAAAAPATPEGAAVPSAVSKSQVAGAWVFGAILLGLLVVFLYFPPPKAASVTGFCIEAVITAIFAGLFGYFILGATNQNWNWKITENLSVGIQATGGFALTIGTAALFLGMYYWNGQRPATPAATAASPGTANTPPATAVAPSSDVSSLNAKVLTIGPEGGLELGTLERGMQRLGYQPGDTVVVTISGQQYHLPYVQNRATAAQGEDYLFILANKRVVIATQGKSFAAKHGVTVGASVELLKKQ